MTEQAPQGQGSGPTFGRPTGDKAIRGRGFGHGKVILLGEHAVVYDQPALFCGLSQGLSAEATDGSGRLSIPAWQADAHPTDGTELGSAWGIILNRLGGSDLDVHITGELPPGAGLGSSAALSIATARAVAAARGQGLESAYAAATAAEGVFHGTPSGIDLAAASSGELGWFHRQRGFRPVAALQSMTLCVGLSGRPRATRVEVDAVRRLRERTPAVGRVLAVMGDLVEAGEKALEVGDVDELGRLFDIAHGLLAALRVSSPEIETMVHGARAAGAVGAKLTGAGGGGAVIALAPGHERDVLAAWRRAGFEGFTTAVGRPASGGAATELAGAGAHPTAERPGGADGGNQGAV